MFGRKKQGERTSRPPKRFLLKDWDRKSVHVEPREPSMEIFERMLLGDRIGEGGLCFVDEAFDNNLLRSVARKSIKPWEMKNASLFGRLVEEAQITAQLDHPNIVPVHELGTDGEGNLYFTMKRVRGQTFNELITAQDNRSRSDQALFEQLQIFLKVCDAIAFAHDRGVIHQDIKPDNIMVGEFGEVYMMDWGFARLKDEARPSKQDLEALGTAERRRFKIEEDDGVVAATLFYMAPEQAKGEHDQIDEQTDVFCLGGILYKLLTGQPPYSATTAREIYLAALEAHISPPEDVVDFSLPPRLCEICMRALRLSKDERYESVLELKQEIEKFLQSGWQFQRRSFPKGSVIVREGEPGDDAYIVMSGKCRIFKMVEGRELDLGLLQKGDVFGELAVFANQPRSASIEVLEATSVLVVTRRHFEEDLGMTYWLGLFVKALADRFHESSARVIELEQRLEKAGLSTD